jgi:hypothetical protein
MVGKIFITRSGYDPQLGKHVKDPYLGPNPTLGACRPDVRKQLTQGDHIFVISGKVPVAPQYVMGGFEIAAKIDPLTAYQQFPEQRLHRLPDGQLAGNIVINANGKQHRLDTHNFDKPKSFEERIKNYVVGTNLLALTTDEEIDRGRDQTLEALSAILHKRGSSPVEVVGRWGSKLNEQQVLELRAWLESLKANRN